MAVNRVRVLLLDNEVLVCQGIASMLAASGWIDVVGQLVDMDLLMNRLAEFQPDVILLKAGMCNCDPISIVRTVRRTDPVARFILLSEPYRETEREIEAAIDSGVRGIVSRSLEVSDLLSCIRIVLHGGLVFATPLASRVWETMWSAQESGPHSNTSVWDNRAIPMALANTGLSEREFDVLTLLAEGASNRQIAELLSITENTAKTHVRNILEKLQLQSRTHAAAFAIRRGFVRSPDSD